MFSPLYIFSRRDSNFSTCSAPFGSILLCISRLRTSFIIPFAAPINLSFNTGFPVLLFIKLRGSLSSVCFLLKRWCSNRLTRASISKIPSFISSKSNPLTLPRLSILRMSIQMKMIIMANKINKMKSLIYYLCSNLSMRFSNSLIFSFRYSFCFLSIALAPIKNAIKIKTTAQFLSTSVNRRKIATAKKESTTHLIFLYLSNLIDFIYKKFASNEIIAPKTATTADQKAIFLLSLCDSCSITSLRLITKSVPTFLSSVRTTVSSKNPRKLYFRASRSSSLSDIFQ